MGWKNASRAALLIRAARQQSLRRTARLRR
jgi:hypothetical protein